MSNWHKSHVKKVKIITSTCDYDKFLAKNAKSPSACQSSITKARDFVDSAARDVHACLSSIEDYEKSPVYIELELPETLDMDPSSVTVEVGPLDGLTPFFHYSPGSSEAVRLPQEDLDYPSDAVKSDFHKLMKGLSDSGFRPSKIITLFSVKHPAFSDMLQRRSLPVGSHLFESLSDAKEYASRSSGDEVWKVRVEADRAISLGDGVFELKDSSSPVRLISAKML